MVPKEVNILWTRIVLKMSGSASQVEKSCLGRQAQRSLLKKEVRKVVETVWTAPPGKGRYTIFDLLLVSSFLCVSVSVSLSLCLGPGLHLNVNESHGNEGQHRNRGH